MADVLPILTLALAGLAALLAFLAWRSVASGPRESASQHPDTAHRLSLIERGLTEAPRDIRADLTAFKSELGQALAIHTQQIETRLGRFEQSQGGQLAGLRVESADGRRGFEEALDRHVQGFAHAQTTRLMETNLAMTALREGVEAQQARAQAEQKAALDAIAGKLEALNAGAADRQDALRTTLATTLEVMRAGNEKKLDEMRATVDEKLQGSLERRFNDSFKLVSDRLDQVHKGLGEMQTLATGVGDLKRVLTNVKSRGTWGEVQLGALLEDLLTPDQFERQARIRPETAEVVDFAVRLPGQSEEGRVLLPIDCKYPQEDYERLITAQEAGDAGAVEIAGRALERALRIQARSINEKYVHPPASTNFAIMYLPTEGLFAEVVRRPGFAQELQQTLRITVAGPTTLAALLNSLRMGFTTLEIQKKSSEVWTVLGQTKTAFLRYGEALEAVDKKLDEAKKKVADVGVKHREITRKLRSVEVAEPPRLDAIIAALPAPDGGEEEAA